MLSRALAESGHFPAIDIEQSASRVMQNVVPKSHFDLARRFKAVYSCYQKGHDLVQIGAYVGGSDRSLDEAIALHEPMMEFLKQDMFESSTLQNSVDEMVTALGVSRVAH